MMLHIFFFLLFSIIFTYSRLYKNTWDVKSFAIPFLLSFYETNPKSYSSYKYMPFDAETEFLYKLHIYE